MLLSSSVMKLGGNGVVGDLAVLVVVVVPVVVDVVLAVVLGLMVFVVGALVVPFFGSFVASLDAIELGGLETTVASALS